MATILCIDDEPTVLELQKALLESKGYKVLTARDGPAGIAFTRKHSIAAVLLDFNMPGMDGNQVAQILIKEQPALPFVICSGCPDQIPEALKWFADAVFYKSDGPEILLSALKKIVSSSTNTAKKQSAQRARRATVQDFTPAA